MENSRNQIEDLRKQLQAKDEDLKKQLQAKDEETKKQIQAKDTTITGLENQLKTANDEIKNLKSSQGYKVDEVYYSLNFSKSAIRGWVLGCCNIGYA